jgi:ADP-ribose pyrophosphatase
MEENNIKTLPKIIEKKLILDKFLKVEEVLLEENGKQFTRLNVLAPDSVGMVLFNIDTKKVLMLKQYRYSANGYIYEIPAGRIDEGETDIDTAVRETLEETGYSIQGKKLERICTYYSNVGFTSERITLFMTVVTNKDKIKDTFGVNSETEIITLEELSVDDIIKMLDNGTIQDGKSIIGLNHLLKRIISQMYEQVLGKIKGKTNPETTDGKPTV